MSHSKEIELIAEDLYRNKNKITDHQSSYPKMQDKDTQEEIHQFHRTKFHLQDIHQFHRTILT